MLFVWGTTVISIAGTSAYTIVVSCTVIFLFLSFTVPIALGLFAHGTPKWDKMGPWDLGAGMFKLFAVLSIAGDGAHLLSRHPAAERLGARITLGFLVLTAVVWFGFERKRFQGPPIGDVIARRQSEIAKAEAAVGEKGA